MINTVGIVGLGAIGALYAERFRNVFPKENVICIADADRIKRYRKGGVFVNGQRLDITYVSGDDASPVDLLIYATKYYSLEDAAKMSAKACGDDTIVMSFLNGVISEDIIADIIHPKKLLYTTVQAMDAKKEGNQIIYHQSGNVTFNEKDNHISESVNEVNELFEKCGIAHSNPDDIMRQLYSKWMLNVGVNQTCAYFACTYSECYSDGKYYDMFIAAMKEARACANAMGVNLTDNDIAFWAKVVEGLSPESEPSMRQDTRAGRPTEAGLFCGSVIDIAEKYNIDVPVNRMFAERFM